MQIARGLEIKQMFTKQFISTLKMNIDIYTTDFGDSKALSQSVVNSHTPDGGIWEEKYHH